MGDTGEGRGRGPLARLAVTLALPLGAWAATKLVLPGIEDWQLETMRRGAPDGDLTAMSVVALGLAPALSAFVLVELVALAVPGWRALRRRGPDERRRLTRAALVVTVLLAAIQGWFVATVLQAMLRHAPDGSLLGDPGVMPRLLITVTLIGGTCFLLALAWLIERYGLGNGFSILLAAAVVRVLAGLGRAFTGPTADAGFAAPLVLQLAITIGLTVWILGAPRRASADAPPLVRDPTSGIVPLVMAAALLGLPAQLAAFGLPMGALARLEPGTVAYTLTYAALVTAACLILSRWFNRPGALAAVWSRLGTPPAPAQLLGGLRAGVTRSLLFVVTVGVIVPRLIARARGGVMSDVALIIVTTAVIMDVVAEWRARRQHGALVAVWPLHQVAFLGAVQTALERAGIPVHARGAYHRALLHFFGPYVAIDLMVPAARAAEAHELVRQLVVSDG